MDIIFAGASHHGIWGYRSLCKSFDRIFILKDSAENIITQKRDSDVVVDTFDDAPCKLVYLCGYGKFISEDQLKNKVYINTHESLLPKYRGMHPIFYAVLNGDKVMGVTMHIVSKKMDAGDILGQFSFENDGLLIIDIKKKIDEIVYENAVKICLNYLAGNLMGTPQDEDVASYGAKRNLTDCYIDFNKSISYLYNFVQALTYDYPLPRIVVRGEEYEVLPEVKFKRMEYYGPIGRVVDKHEGETWINVQDGFIIIKTITRNGKEALLSDLVPIGYRFL